MALSNAQMETVVAGMLNELDDMKSGYTELTKMLQALHDATIDQHASIRQLVSELTSLRSIAGNVEDRVIDISNQTVRSKFWYRDTSGNPMQVDYGVAPRKSTVSAEHAALDNYRIISTAEAMNYGWPV